MYRVTDNEFSQVVFFRSTHPSHDDYGKIIYAISTKVGWPKKTTSVTVLFSNYLTLAAVTWLAACLDTLTAKETKVFISLELRPEKTEMVKDFFRKMVASEFKFTLETDIPEDYKSDDIQIWSAKKLWYYFVKILLTTVSCFRIFLCSPFWLTNVACFGIFLFRELFNYKICQNIFF